MKAIISAVLSLVIISLPLSVYAHGGEAHIELNVTQAQPGMSIEARGDGFEASDTATIMLVLVGSDRPQTLGTAAVNDKGDLTQTVVLPVDLISGAYEVRVADDHHMATAELSIVTEASAEEGAQRAEEEPLLAPMPQAAAISNPTGSANSSGVVSPSTVAPAPQPSVAPLLSLSLVLSVLVGGAVLIVRRAR